MAARKKIFRFFSIDWSRLHRAHQSRWVIIDLIMLALVLINLAFIGFDWAFEFEWVKWFWYTVSPQFHNWYRAYVHPYFFQIDLAFVAIFLTEVLIRWAIAIYKRSYDRWFFYPFVHWYDVLSCIPMNGAFRLLRFLRIFSMAYRLQRVGAVDFTSTYLYRKFIHFSNILVEEISDRVVVNVLDGIQDEIKKGHPVTDRILQDVLLPRQGIMVEWFSKNISEAVSVTYINHRTELKNYISEVVTRSIKENPEIKNIEMIPGLGKVISATLDRSISDITFKVLDNIMNDMATAKNKRGVKEVTDAIFYSILDHPTGSRELNDMIVGIVNDSLDVVKEEVLVQQWKVKEEEMKEMRLKARMEKEMQKTFESLPPE